MSQPVRELEMRTGIISSRLHDGWTVARHDDGERTITSPRGVMFLAPERDITPALAEEALVELDELGYQEDLDRYGNRPRATPQTANTADQEEAATTMPPAKNATARKPAARKKTTLPETSPVAMFIYPDEPQRLSLDDVLPPEGGDPHGERYLLPKVIVTADMARAFLGRVATEHNRRRRKSNTRSFMKLMTDGKFQVTHQGLAFNQRGELADGQHRIEALVALQEENPKSEPEIVVDITYNVPTEMAFALDGGAKRSNVDHATVAGVDNPTVVTRLVRLLYLYREAVARKTGNWKDIPPLTPDEVVEWAEKYGDDLLEAWAAIKPLKQVKGLNLNAAAIWYFVAREAWAEAPVDEFVHGLSEMEWTYPYDARKCLYRWAGHSKERRVDQRHHLALIGQVYNDFCTETPRRNIKWLPKWEFPTPYTPETKSARKK